MKIVRRFGGAWQVMGFPFWIKPYAGLVDERDQRVRWFAIEIDNAGATVDIWKFTFGLVCGRIKKP